MSESCSPDLIREHERRIAENDASSKSAHLRITNITEIFHEFSGEMREMNKNMADMNTNVCLIAQEVKVITETTTKHDSDISDIKDTMETKEGMSELHRIVGEIKDNMANLDERLVIEESKEAREALKQINGLKKWFIGLIATIIVAVVLGYFGLR